MGAEIIIEGGGEVFHRQALSAGADARLKRIASQGFGPAWANAKFNLAHNLHDFITSKRRTLWPQDTQDSRRAWIIEDVAGSNTIPVINTTHYARYVNNDAYIGRSNKRNKNRYKAQATLIKYWDEAVEDALDEAGIS